MVHCDEPHSIPVLYCQTCAHQIIRVIRSQLLQS